VTKALSNQGVSFAIPGTLLVYFVWAAFSAGVLGDRAGAVGSRLKVLESLAYEQRDASLHRQSSRAVPAFRRG
jgi:hypothetical protein